MVEQVETEVKTVTIQTTIGDLICAIADAAKEASIQDEDLMNLTEQVLHEMLKKRC